MQNQLFYENRQIMKLCLEKNTNLSPLKIIKCHQRRLAVSFFLLDYKCCDSFVDSFSVFLHPPSKSKQTAQNKADFPSLPEAMISKLLCKLDG